MLGVCNVWLGCAGQMRAGRAGPHNKTVPANTAADAQLTVARNSPRTPLAGRGERAQVAKSEQSKAMDIKYFCYFALVDNHRHGKD